MIDASRDAPIFVIPIPKDRNLRCSRPLCSSQSTGGTPRHPPKGNDDEVRRPIPNPSGLVPIPQDPTACTSPGIPTTAFQARRSEELRPY